MRVYVEKLFQLRNTYPYLCRPVLKVCLLFRCCVKTFLTMFWLCFSETPFKQPTSYWGFALLSNCTPFAYVKVFPLLEVGRTQGVSCVSLSWLAGWPCEMDAGEEVRLDAASYCCSTCDGGDVACRGPTARRGKTRSLSTSSAGSSSEYK